MAKTKGNKEKVNVDRTPWISKNTGVFVMAVISVVLAGWVIWQMTASGNTIGKSIFWGAIFGASIWLVYFGMNYFHSLFDNKQGK